MANSSTKPLKWHAQQEHILRKYGEQSSCYRYMHYKAYQKFKKLSFRFTLPIIMISTVTGTANFAQETFPDSWKVYVPVCIGAFNLLAAIMTTILQFMKINELMESHRVSSVHYGKLSRSIRLQLTLPKTERSHSGLEFVNGCNNEYDRLIEQSPPIPSNIIRIFEKEFPLVADGDPKPPSMCIRFKRFMCEDAVHEKDENLRIERPEIIKLTPIKPYGFHDGTTTSSAVQTMNTAAAVRRRFTGSPIVSTHVDELKQIFAARAAEAEAAVEASETETMSSEVPDEIDVVIHQSEVGVVEMARRFENSDGVDSHESEQY
jgi:hypothetical protein